MLSPFTFYSENAPTGVLSTTNLQSFVLSFPGTRDETVRSFFILGRSKFLNNLPKTDTSCLTT